eukprot:scpid4981/ scgid14511/ Usherin; Usher syndrome type IIa protein homolog; Usher syndrome type-2A protein homolog
MMAVQAAVWLLVGFSATCVVQPQVLETPSLLIDPIGLVNFEAVGTCPGAGIASETYNLPGEPLNSRTCDANSNPPSNANTNTSVDTFWKSANNLELTSLTAEFTQPYVVNFIQFRLAAPRSRTLRVSGSRGDGFRDFIYIVTEIPECMSVYNVAYQPVLELDNSNIGDPFCVTYDDINALSLEIFDARLFNERTVIEADGNRLNPRRNPTVVDLFTANFLSLEFRGFSDVNFPFTALQRMSVGAHCVCNGHTTNCSMAEAGFYVCNCEENRNVMGTNCEMCQPLFNQQPFTEARACEQCQCYGHATSCVFDPTAVGSSVNASGVLTGGGRCVACDGSTTGVNCQDCIPQFYHPGTPSSIDLTVNCLDCGCTTAGQMFASGNCSEGTGICINCKVNVMGDQCQLCRPDFFDLLDVNDDGCEPCNCDPAGTEENTVCNMVGGQCDCKASVTGRTCNMCSDMFFNLTADNALGCTPCECNLAGSVNNSCDVTTGACICLANITGRQCDQCIPTSFDFPTCSDCECVLAGQIDRTNLCDASTGVCINCKVNVDPSNKCEVCRDGFYDLLDSDEDGCKPCECNINGTVNANNVCDKTTGQCVCKANVIGRQCDMCADNFTMFNSDPTDGCTPCECFPAGSTSPVCNKDNGMCDCASAFMGTRCDECVPQAFGFPACEPCGCSVAGTVNSNTSCNPMSGQCDCLSTHTERRCDMCALDHFGMPLSTDSDLVCRPCNCNQFGSTNSSCDPISGQCNCVPTTTGVRCDMCQPRHFNITSSDDGTDTFGGGCLRCDQCTDDLLNRACRQESIVLNATIRVNSSEVRGLIESSNALGPLEDRYRPLRMSTNTWRAAQMDQLERLEVLRQIELNINTNISVLLTRATINEVEARRVQNLAFIQLQRINALIQTFSQIFTTVNDNTILLAQALQDLRNLRSASQSIVDESAAVQSLTFDMEERVVRYAYQNATQLRNTSATQQGRAMRNAATADELASRLQDAIAALDTALVQRIVQYAADIDAGLTAVNGVLSEGERLVQEAVLGRSRYMGSIALTSGANTAAYNALDAAQASLDMVISALQTITTYLPQLTNLRGDIMRDLTENSPATTYYLVTIAEGLLAPRQTYASQIEDLFNSTQPHAAEAAELIIDYRMADEDLQNSTALLLQGENAFNAASTAAANAAATQQQAQVQLMQSNTLLGEANAISQFIGQQFAQGGAILLEIGEEVQNASLRFQADSFECLDLFQPITTNGEIIQNQINSIFPLVDCATNATAEYQPRIEQTYGDLSTAEVTANSAVTGAAEINNDLAVLEARRIGMGNEVANVTDGVARLQVAAQQANQSLDDLLSRLERIRGRLTVAQTAYRTANFCCESLRLDVCPNNDNLVRLATSSSYIRFDPGHNGAQPFDFNGDFVDLEFRTREFDGVLVYFANQDQSQFFGVELRNGNTISVRATRADGGTASFEAPGTYNDNMFHSLRLAILGPLYFLSIDNGPFLFATFTTPGAFTIINAPLYIGGTPTVAQGLLRPGEMTRPSLIGCFRNVVYNQVQLNVLEPSFISGHIPCNCTLDAPGPTTPPPTTTPPTVMPTLAPCMNVTPAVGQGVRLNGGLASDSFLQFGRRADAIAPLNFQEGALLTISFRTYAQDGVLVYMSNADHTHVIAVEVRNGYVSTVVRGGGTQLRVSLTLVPVSDGNVHQIDLFAVPTGGNSGIIFLVVDDTNNPANSFQEFEVIGDSFDFSDSNLYVGGAPSPAALLMTGETTRPALDGCMLQFVQQSAVLDLGSYTAQQNTGPCFLRPILGLRFPGSGYASFEGLVANTPSQVQLTLRTSTRAGFIFHVGSATTGTSTAYITPMGMVNLRVTTANGETMTVTGSPPLSRSTICNGEFIQVTASVGDTFISLNVGGMETTVPFGVAVNGGVTSTGQLIVGRPPESVLMRDNLPSLPGLEGCVSQILYDSLILPVAFSRRVGGVSLGCGLP